MYVSSFILLRALIPGYKDNKIKQTVIFIIGDLFLSKK